MRSTNAAASRVRHGPQAVSCALADAQKHVLHAVGNTGPTLLTRHPVLSKDKWRSYDQADDTQAPGPLRVAAVCANTSALAPSSSTHSGVHSTCRGFRSTVRAQRHTCYRAAAKTLRVSHTAHALHRPPSLSMSLSTEKPNSKAGGRHTCALHMRPCTRKRQAWRPSNVVGRRLRGQPRLQLRLTLFSSLQTAVYYFKDGKGTKTTNSMQPSIAEQVLRDFVHLAS